jgi:pyruvate carboxylase subunit B
MNLGFGLQISVIGILIVFAALAILIVAITLLKRAFKLDSASERSTSDRSSEGGSIEKEVQEEVTPVEHSGRRDFKVVLDGKEYVVAVEDAGGRSPKEDVIPHSKIGRNLIIKIGDDEYEMTVEDVGVPSIMPSSIPEAEVKEEVKGNTIEAPMQGTIIKIPVSVGDEVGEGDVVAVLEAMKMENNITSPKSGRVMAINVSIGDSVRTGDAIVVIG